MKAESAINIDRQSYWLASAGTELLTHAHLPKTAGCSSAVLICGSIGFEATHANRSMVRMADEFAANDIAAFRFDYSGTGNSSADAHLDRMIERWQKNIIDQCNHLQSKWGFSSISLVGFRFGAVLLSSVIERLDIDRVTFWEPVARGKSFVREIRAAAQFAKDPKLADGAQLESGGFVYSDTTVAEIESLTLDSDKLASNHSVLLVSRGTNPKLSVSAERIGFRFTEMRSGEYDKMVCEPHFTKLPIESMSRISSWHRADLKPGVKPFHMPTLRHSALVTGMNDLPPCTETALRTPEGDLFAITTQPGPAQSTTPRMVVLPNAGSVCNIGPNRIYVQIARALAASGITVVRFDLRNLGESVTGDVNDANAPYPDSASDDLSEMLQFLRTRFKPENLTLAGLCSGSHASYHYGLSKPVADVDELILINPLTFYWHPGMSLSNPQEHRNVRNAKTYARSAQSGRNWRRLLTGQVNYRRLAGFSIGLMRRYLSNLLKRVAAIWSRTPLTRMDEDLLILEQRNIRLAYVFSDSDPGYWIAKADSPRTFPAHEKSGLSPIVFVEDADHTMSKAQNRQALVRELQNMLGVAEPQVSG